MLLRWHLPLAGFKTKSKKVVAAIKPAAYLNAFHINLNN
jgi:hypothetical protein